jgi:hypothetical protein
MQPAGAPVGPGYIFSDNHLAVTRGANGTTTFNVKCSETTPGQQCAEGRVGWPIDGVEITAPGSSTPGFRNANGFNLRQPATFKNNVFTVATTTLDIGAGLIKVPFGGIVGCDTSATSPNTLVSATPSGKTSTALVPTQTCPVDFVSYGAGNYAFGYLNNPGQGVHASPPGTGNDFNQDFGGFSIGPTQTATQSGAGKQFNSSYYFYDQTSSGLNALDRCGFLGMPENSTPAFECDTTTGMATGWPAWLRIDPVNGLQITTTAGPSSGVSANYVQNSTNLTATGWPGLGAVVTAITAGQTDPYKGTHASLVTVAGSTSNWNYNNSSSSAFTSGVTLTACAWMKGAVGGEVVFFDADTSTNILPVTSVTLTTSWARYCSTGVSASTTRAFRFGGNTTTPAFQFYIYNPQTQPGSTAGPDLEATTSIFTPQSVLSADIIKAGGISLGSALKGTTASIGGSALAAGACATGTVSISGVAAGMTGTATATDGTMQGNFVVSAAGTASGTATVNVCAITAGTPTAKTYNVHLNQ